MTAKRVNFVVLNLLQWSNVLIPLFRRLRRSRLDIPMCYIPTQQYAFTT